MLGGKFVPRVRAVALTAGSGYRSGWVSLEPIEESNPASGLGMCLSINVSTPLSIISYSQIHQ